MADVINMRVPMTYHQRTSIEILCNSYPKFLMNYYWRCHDVLIEDNCTVSISQADWKDEILKQRKRNILNSGSLCYNKIIDTLQKQSMGSVKDDIDELCMMIILKHNVKELHRFVWIHEATKKIVRIDNCWYVNIEDCYEASQKKYPKYKTYDNDPDPKFVVGIESVCPCASIDPYKVGTNAACLCRI